MPNGDKTFTDRLRDRRTQLFGQGDPLGLGETPQGQAVQEAAGVQSERLSSALRGEKEFQEFPQDILASEDFFLGRAGNFLQPLIQNALRELEIQDAKAQQEQVDTGEVQAAADAVMSGKLKLINVPQEIRVAAANRLTQMGFDPASDINIALAGMEGAFFGEQPTAGLGGTDIALGGFKPLELLRQAGLAGEKFLGTAKGQRAEIYTDQKEAFVGQLKVIAGETGVLNDRDIERLKRALPDTGDTFAQAQVKFGQTKAILNAKFGGAGLTPLASEGQPANLTTGTLGIPTAGATGVSPVSAPTRDVYVQEVGGFDY